MSSTAQVLGKWHSCLGYDWEFPDIERIILSAKVVSSTFDLDERKERLFLLDTFARTFETKADFDENIRSLWMVTFERLRQERAEQAIQSEALPTLALEVQKVSRKRRRGVQEIEEQAVRAKLPRISLMNTVGSVLEEAVSVGDVLDAEGLEEVESIRRKTRSLLREFVSQAGGIFNYDWFFEKSTCLQQKPTEFDTSETTLITCIAILKQLQQLRL
eukprot:TRINITY_DN10421_c0_g1_i2.p1 TRINITY_DN10421_c0_g1~~TRINITY_DN10421_c0_g1_i2.p1  ORF type:complete len:217 (+),score=36.23 TRINITY_DN10421_c0_g1_i2:446-1096(+)